MLQEQLVYQLWVAFFTLKARQSTVLESLGEKIVQINQMGFLFTNRSLTNRPTFNYIFLLTISLCISGSTILK